MTANAEYRLHIAIVELLNRAKVPGVIFWHTPNGGSRNKIEAAKLKRMGVRPGIPDIIISMPDRRMAFVEVKTKGGRVSPEQRAFLLDMHMRGHDTAWVRSLDEAIEFLSDCGAICSGVSVAA